MRTSPLRPYVIQLMNDYQLHTFQDILDSANSYFSETPYTEKAASLSCQEPKKIRDHHGRQKRLQENSNTTNRFPLKCHPIP